MEREERNSLYVHMSAGTVGLVILALALVKLNEAVPGVESACMMISFPLAMTYLHYLEKRAGISKKLIWTRSCLAILLMTAVGYLMFE